MTIKRALLSVSDKTNLVPFAKALADKNITLLSTGGTAKALRTAGLEVTDVSSVTDFPEIMDGRVKTLHPKIHGGILANRDKTEHLAAMDKHGITGIDLVVLNLYPFEATVARGADYAETVENIDIGGPAMLRASAKNHAHVTIVTDPVDYDTVLAELDTNNGATTLEFRKTLALKAFSLTAHYDSAISKWLAKSQDTQFPARFSQSAQLESVLRYGENPHQNAALYKTDAKPGTLAGAKQLQGKALSYNNLNDTDAAWALANEFSEPCVAIIKHANPCGVALGSNIVEAFHKALACDPTSAYGGIIATNQPLTAEFVEAMGKLFAEVVIAPSVEPAAADALTKKKNLRLLDAGGLLPKDSKPLLTTQISGGILLQDTDSKRISESDLTIVSAAQPEVAQLEDLLFAFRICKHVKSNAIVIVRDGATVGIGAGQMSRVDSVRIACWKAGEAGLSTKGAVLASDAFFPFDDNVHRAADAGIAALVQPGGSIRDNEVIAAADKHGMVMVTTGIRHFRH
ncbi:MAG: bifunctional phosphoribosylaminoimidazolecarboxamide formyltransferase/IMP cyclohydrolase [Rickettsiales bacterium]|nr:bifunctional phosphoribosylaminoimidazolecarboxamide formyltransferase/IMP cyclohydrolase [Rickettsiales bacterium]